MVSIKEFMELREAGYSVDQIREYSDFLDSKPEAAPSPAAPAPAAPVQPAQPAPAAQDPAPAPQLSPDQMNDNRDILQTILSTIRGMNINNSNMPAPSERNAQDILAEIINPKEGK